jgi:hypothetical protein
LAPGVHFPLWVTSFFYLKESAEGKRQRGQTETESLNVSMDVQSSQALWLLTLTGYAETKA